MSKDLMTELCIQFYSHADAAQAVKMSAYMRNHERAAVLYPTNNFISLLVK
ncbi:hypothetical protein PilKf_01471 [Pillotina sp. SPG140]|jgi:hypothetical protein